MEMSSNVVLIKTETGYRLIDNDNHVLHERKILRLLNLYQDFFDDLDTFQISEIDYVKLSELINNLSKTLDSKFHVQLDIEDDVKNFIDNETYYIEQERLAGASIKAYDERWTDAVNEFTSIINEEVARPLLSQQIQASFYLIEMRRAANFSVPGAGKTAMTYGAYAYLSSPKIDKVNRMLVLSPINAFEAWRTEYQEVFGEKRELRFLNIKDTKDSDLAESFYRSNVAVLNYESLNQTRLQILNRLIDEKTMIVFDEVHRIKNPAGQRAQRALQLGKQAKYHYVLTGTPIPNSYQDIYNMLHILYGTEYDTHFGFDLIDLNTENAKEINEKINPFFWRTTKQDLKVPAAEEDIKKDILPNDDQIRLAETIYEVETNILAKYIRLMQASTNPALLTQKIDWEEIGLIKGVDFSINGAFNELESKAVAIQAYMDLNVEQMESAKFNAGIDLIARLVSEGKSVVVWGMFVGTMVKIKKYLQELSISANLIYGDTPKNERVGLINEFKRRDVQVLISNPATLGESISLHKTAHDAVYFEYNFNLTFMLQSRDRIHRLGLEDNQYTRYYYLRTKGDKAHHGYIDTAVYDRLKKKEEIMLDAIEGDVLKPMINDDYFDEIQKLLK